MAETINADELDVNEEVVTEEVETESEDEDETTDDDYVNTLEAELEKARADKEKWENRYKSTKKKESVKPKKQNTNTQDVDLDSIVEKKLMAIEEQREFIKEHGEDVFNEVKKVKAKHPSLSLEDAYKISPISSDEASKENAESLAMGGRANSNAINDSKSITLEQYVALPQKQYSMMKDRIAKGEVTLKQ